jgi:hypothetical protein
VPGSFAQVGGGVWGFEGARLVGPGLSQILPSHMILAKLYKIKLLLLISLKFLSSPSESCCYLPCLLKKNILQKVKKRTNSETKTCTEV